MVVLSLNVTGMVHQGVLGSGQYGKASPTCPLGSFYDMTTGSAPACRSCVGFSWNLDSELGCYPPLQDPDQKFFCGECRPAARLDIYTLRSGEYLRAEDHGPSLTSCFVQLTTNARE